MFLFLCIVSVFVVLFVIVCFVKYAYVLCIFTFHFILVVCILVQLIHSEFYFSLKINMYINVFILWSGDFFLSFQIGCIIIILCSKFLFCHESIIQLSLSRTPMFMWSFIVVVVNVQCSTLYEKLLPGSIDR